MSAILDPLQVAAIRTSLETTLGETCTIRKRETVNTGTGPVITESDRAINVPCRRAGLGDRTGTAVNVAGASRDQEEVVVTFKIDQVVKAPDRLVFPDRSYEVLRVLTTGFQTLVKRVLCKAV